MYHAKIHPEKQKTILICCVLTLFVSALVPAFNFYFEKEGVLQNGIELIEKGNYIDAETYFENAIDRFPKKSQLYVNLGVVKQALGHIEEAERCFKKGLGLEPKNHQHHNLYAQFLTDQKRYGEAEKHLKKSLQIHPKNKKGFVQLANIYHRTHKWELLRVLAGNSIKEKLHISEAKNFLDVALEKKTFHAHLEEIVQKSPTAKNHYNLGKEYLDQKMYAQSYHHTNRALWLQNDYPEAHCLMGIACEKLGNAKKAEKAFKRALRSNPNLWVAQKHLSRLDGSLHNSKMGQKQAVIANTYYILP